MKVSETLSFNEYFSDKRFQLKKPIINGSRKQARGDNIYNTASKGWTQLDSFHSNDDGSANSDHINRDTNTNRVLISEEFIYFGKDGPFIPEELESCGKPLCHKGISESKFSGENPTDRAMIMGFIEWYDSFEEKGFISHPFDWSDTQ